MSEIAAEPKQAQGVKAPVLSRTGLILVILILMGTPIILIGAVWYTLPPIRETPLDARVNFVDFVDVYEYRNLEQSKKQELYESIRNEEFLPAVTIRNASDERWENIGVTINGTFDFISGDAVEPGQIQKLYLHRFQTRQGDEFRPLEYEIRRVRVFARLPNGERGFYEAEVDAAGRVVSESHQEEEAE